MKWPWVSRSLYEESCKTVRNLEDRIVHWQSVFQRVHDEKHEGTLAYADLLNKYHALKVQGAVSVPDYGYIEPPLTVDEQDALRAQEDDA
jgi:hypothetical protein